MLLSYLSKYFLTSSHLSKRVWSHKRKIHKVSIRFEMWKVETLLTDILCIDFGFGWWSVLSSLFFSSAKQDTVTHKTPLITASAHKGWDLRHPIIMASRRMVLDWLSFSLEAKCMDRLRRYVKLYRNGTVIRSALSEDANGIYLWKQMVLTKGKKCTLLFQVKIIGWRLVSDQLFVVKASLDWAQKQIWFV